MKDRTIDHAAIQEDWARRGFSCDLWIDPPGWVWADFVHDADELVLVLEGSQEFELNGEKRRPGIGTELLIPAGTHHTARNVGTVTSKWLYGYRR